MRVLNSFRLLFQKKRTTKIPKRLDKKIESEKDRKKEKKMNSNENFNCSQNK